MASGTLVLWPGLNPHPLHWESIVFTTGPPGKSWKSLLTCLISYNTFSIHCTNLFFCVYFICIYFYLSWNKKVKVKSLSRVWLFATPQTAAYQAPPPMGFSKQEYWSGVPLPSPEVRLESSNTEGSGDEIVENAHKPSQWLQTFQPIGHRELLKNWQQESCHVLEILSSRKNSWRAVKEEWSLWLALWELLIQSW